MTSDRTAGLIATYRARAVPPGTARYWSWLFAAAESRDPLLGIFALGAEWQALMDPATDSAMAHLKLAWWREEVQRLITGSPVHPIGVYLAALPRADAVDFTPLLTAVDAAAHQVGGVPLERGADLEPQSSALWGGPLALATWLGAEVSDPENLQKCTDALAAAHCLSRAIRHYPRDARVGRVPFAIDELIAARVDNDELIADPPPTHLQNYLDLLRARAARYFESAAHALPLAERRRHRHLLVLAALGAAHLNRRADMLPRKRLKDMILAWTTARRAHE